MRRHAAAQATCLAFGFLGVAFFITPFMLLGNARSRWRLWRLPAPRYRAAEVVSKRGEPASIAVPWALRIICWSAVLAALAAIIISKVYA